MSTEFDQLLSNPAGKFPSVRVTERFRENRGQVSSWLQQTVEAFQEIIRRSVDVDRWSTRRHELTRVWNEFYLSARHQLQMHPVWQRMKRETVRLANAFYRRALPVINEIARHSFLTGATAFFCGILVAKIFFPSTKYRCPVKPHKMKAIVYEGNSFDGFENLSLRTDFERPRIVSPDEVLIRVHAASLDPLDIAMLLGLGQNERSLDSSGSFVLGRDFSGVIVEVGIDATEFNVGDAVWSALPIGVNGSLCEYVVMSSAHVRLKPFHLSHDSCATLPFSSLVTWKALVDEAGLQPDSSSFKNVLVVDGTSSTGCIAIQLLNAWSAQVVTCIPYRVAPLAHMLGADNIIPITPADVDAEDKCRHALVNSPKFDVIVLTREYGLLSEEFCQTYLKPSGKLVKTFPIRLPSDSYGFLGKTVLIIWRKFFASPYRVLDVGPLDYIRRLIDEGHFQPVLDSSHRLEDFEAAFHITAAQANIGKAVVNFAAA